MHDMEAGRLDRCRLRVIPDPCRRGGGGGRMGQ